MLTDKTLNYLLYIRDESLFIPGNLITGILPNTYENLVIEVLESIDENTFSGKIVGHISPFPDILNQFYIGHVGSSYIKNGTWIKYTT